MRESYSEILARYADPESYAGDGNIAGVATAGVPAGPEIELRYPAIPRADTVQLSGRQHRSERFGKLALERGGVEGLEHVWKLQTREPGDPRGSWGGPMACHQDGQKTSPRAQLT